jgi:hypothetical protein
MLVANLPPGTLVWREDVHFGAVNHFGVVLQTWPCYVAHIDKGETGHLRVRVEPLVAFAHGRQVTYEPVDEPVPLDAMWTRVNDVAQAKRPFGLLCWGEDWNCESFAHFIKSGLAHSEQAASANGVLFGAAVVGAFALLARGGFSSYDANVGRYRDGKGRFMSR